MGVIGLTTFVDERQREILSNLKLHQRWIIIDGCSLMYFLYHESRLNQRNGGDYENYRSIVKLFFKNLETCSVFSLVVFDGAFDERKRQTHLRRLKEYADNLLPTVMAGLSAPLIKPLLTGETFQQLLVELHVPYIYTLQDADYDVAAISNIFDAYVLSNDSDFYIFPLKAGYIPLKYYHWTEVLTDEHISFTHGKVYESNKLLNLYRLKPPFLAFLPVLLGCDWVKPELLESLRDEILKEDRIEHHRRKWKSQLSKINSILKWLAQHRNENSVMSQIDSALKSCKEMENVAKCLKYFRQLTPSQESIGAFRYQIEKSLPRVECPMIKLAMATCMKKLKASSLKEDDLTFLTRIGRFPTTIFTHAQGNRVVLLPVVVSKVSLPSPHRCSSDVRSASYKLMGIVDVMEYDRHGRDYVEMRAKQGSTCPCQTLEEIMTSSKRSCAIARIKRDWARKYLLEALLGCDVINVERHRSFEVFASSHEDIELLLLVTMFWTLKSKPPAHVVCAVALNLSLLTEGDTREVLTRLPRKTTRDADDATIHEIMEWQCCLKDTIALNRALSCPLRDPQLAFNCTTIASLSIRLSKISQNRVYQTVSEKLVSMPFAENLFQAIITAIYARRSSIADITSSHTGKNKRPNSSCLRQ